jgi:hypothetical protein
LWAETTDISNSGFFCYTMEPFAPGDTLASLIGLRAQSSNSADSDERLYLEAKVEAVRIVMNNGSGFGVGFRILEYRLVNNNGLPSWAKLQAELEAFEPVIEQPVSL